MQNQVYLINSDQEQFKKENSSDVAVDKVPGRGTSADIVKAMKDAAAKG